MNKIIDASNTLKGITTAKSDCPEDDKENTNQSKSSSTLTQRKPSFRKSFTDDCVANGNCKPDQEVYFNKISSTRNKDNFLNNNNNNNIKPPTYDGKCYIENGRINFGKMLTDEVLAADYELVKKAKLTVGLIGEF